MQIIILIILVAIILIGCSPDFKVKQAYTRFSEDKNTLFLADNNRLLSRVNFSSKKGFYLNPFVEKDQRTNEVIVLGFNILNKGYVRFGRILKIEFHLAGGAIIPLYLSSQKNTSVLSGINFTFDIQNNVTDFGREPKINVTGSDIEHEIWETANVTLSEEHFKKLLSSKRFSCIIFGSERSVIYEKSDISPDFLVNLHLFREQYLQ